MKDPYQLLGVSPTVSDAELKRAYHALARKYHPDAYADNPEKAELANRKMREVNEAYDTVMRERAAGGTPTAPPRGATKKADRREEAPPQCCTALVRTLLDKGEYAAALGELYRRPEKARDAEWHYLSARAHLGMRHLHDAIRESNAALRADPKNPEYRKLRDGLRAKREKPERQKRVRRTANAGQSAPAARPSLCRRCCYRSLGMEDGKC